MPDRVFLPTALIAYGYAMARKSLRQELGKKPFESPQKEAILNIARTSDRFQNRFARLFRGDCRPMRCDEIRQHMIQVVPAPLASPGDSTCPLKKGVVKFLSVQDCKYCATYDIGRAAAIQFRNRSEWLGKSLDVIGWQGDLNHMFLYYEVQKGPRGTPEAFKKVVPDALSAEDWFRFHGRYANGERIAPAVMNG